jgi:hypothetical protein
LQASLGQFTGPVGVPLLDPLPPPELPELPVPPLLPPLLDEPLDPPLPLPLLPWPPLLPPELPPLLPPPLPPPLLAPPASPVHGAPCVELHPHPDPTTNALPRTAPSTPKRLICRMSHAQHQGPCRGTCLENPSQSRNHARNSRTTTAQRSYSRRCATSMAISG